MSETVLGGISLMWILMVIYGIICFVVPICIYLMSGRVKEINRTLLRIERLLEAQSAPAPKLAKEPWMPFTVKKDEKPPVTETLPEFGTERPRKLGEPPHDTQP